MAVQEQVNEILIDILDIEEEKITSDAKLMTDLGASSVDLVEIVASLENEFSLDIPDEDAQKLRTVGAIVEYVQSKTS